MAHAYQTKGVQNPAGWLNTLITRTKNQTFDPLPGLPIAAAREERLRLESARLENEIREKQAMALEAAQAPTVPAENLDGRYKSREAATFFESFRAGKEKNSAPAVPIVTNSPSDARQASPLTQQKPLAVKKKGALLISSARKLGVF